MERTAQRRGKSGNGQQQSIQVEIDHIAITPQEFEAALKNNKDNLIALFEVSKKIEFDIQSNIEKVVFGG